MEFGLNGKTAIVTGGARGIGRGICECLAKEKVNIVIFDQLNEEAIATSKHIKKTYAVEAEALILNVSNKGDVILAVNKVLERFKRIDILVNNAGIFKPGWVEDMSEDEWNNVLSVNLNSVFICSQAVLQTMKKQKFGRILNAASNAGIIPDVGISAYCASKASIINFTKAIAAEVALYGITVNAYAPGIIKTPMTEGMISEIGNVQIKQLAAGRFGEPVDVGNLVVFLASEAASYITGAVIPVAGGQLIAQNPWKAHTRFEMNQD